MPKSKRINMRFADDEYQQVVAKAGEMPLAKFCKAAVLGHSARYRKTATKYQLVDPALLHELNAIGNNLNQITRLAHAARRQSVLDAVALADSLDLVRQDLAELVSHYAR